MAYNSTGDFELLTQDEILDALRKFCNTTLNSNYTTTSFKSTDLYKLCYIIMQATMETDTDHAFMKDDMSDILTTLNGNFIPQGSKTQIRTDLYEQTKHIVSFHDPENNDEAGHIYAAIDIVKGDSNFTDVSAVFWSIMADPYFAHIFEGSNEYVKSLDGYSKAVKFECMNKYNIQLDYQIGVYKNVVGYVMPEEDMEAKILENIRNEYTAGDEMFAPFSFIEKMNGRTMGDTCTLTVVSALNGNKNTDIEGAAGTTYKFDQATTLFSLANYMTNITVSTVTVEYVEVSK